MPKRSIASCHVMRGNGVVTGMFGQREDLGEQPFDHRVDELLVDERGLDVDLRELRLAVAAQVFVAEAARDLEVALQPATMQSCLKICGDCGSA